MRINHNFSFLLFNVPRHPLCIHRLQNLDSSCFLTDFKKKSRFSVRPVCMYVCPRLSRVWQDRFRFGFQESVHYIPEKVLVYNTNIYPVTLPTWIRFCLLGLYIFRDDCMFVRDYLAFGWTDFDAVFRKVFVTFWRRFEYITIIDTSWSCPHRFVFVAYYDCRFSKAPIMKIFVEYLN